MFLALERNCSSTNVYTAAMFGLRLPSVWLVAFLLLAPRVASAHVAFMVDPDTEFNPGETVTLHWVDTIQHNTLAYHLEFLLSPDAAPETIARDISPDVHDYDWLVPDVVCDSCQLHVIQDNDLTDYDAFLSITIGLSDSGSTGTADESSASVSDTTSTTADGMTGAGGTTQSSNTADGSSTVSTSSMSAGGSTANVTTVTTDSVGGATGISNADGSANDGDQSTGAPTQDAERSSGSCAVSRSRAPNGRGPLLVLLGVCLGLLVRSRRRPKRTSALGGADPY